MDEYLSLSLAQTFEIIFKTDGDEQALLFLQNLSPSLQSQLRFGYSFLRDDGAKNCLARKSCSNIEDFKELIVHYGDKWVHDAELIFAIQHLTYEVSDSRKKQVFELVDFYPETKDALSSLLTFDLLNIALFQIDNPLALHFIDLFIDHADPNAFLYPKIWQIPTEILREHGHVTDFHSPGSYTSETSFLSLCCLMSLSDQVSKLLPMEPDIENITKFRFLDNDVSSSVTSSFQRRILSFMEASSFSIPEAPLRVKPRI